jgi:hypothetical protein
MTWYLRFCAFLLKTLFELKGLKLGNKWHIVENKTDYTACIKNAVNFLAEEHKINL